MSRRDTFSPVARGVPFDNSTNGFLADEVQSAIEENKASSSPGFTWGRSGNLSAGAWLLNESVPSNKAGRTITLSSARIVKIFTASEDLDTYTLRIYHHDGNEVNLTLLTTLTVTASRTGDSGAVSISIPANKQLAAQLFTGTAKNLVAGVIVQGSTV